MSSSSNNRKDIIAATDAATPASLPPPLPIYVQPLLSIAPFLLRLKNNQTNAIDYHCFIDIAKVVEWLRRHLHQPYCIIHELLDPDTLPQQQPLDILTLPISIPPSLFQSAQAQALDRRRSQESFSYQWWHRLVILEDLLSRPREFSTSASTSSETLPYPSLEIYGNRDWPRSDPILCSVSQSSSQFTITNFVEPPRLAISKIIGSGHHSDDIIVTATTPSSWFGKCTTTGIQWTLNTQTGYLDYTDRPSPLPPPAEAAAAVSELTIKSDPSSSTVPTLDPPQQPQPQQPHPNPYLQRRLLLQQQQQQQAALPSGQDTTSVTTTTTSIQYKHRVCLLKDVQCAIEVVVKSL